MTVRVDSKTTVYLPRNMVRAHLATPMGRMMRTTAAIRNLALWVAGK